MSSPASVFATTSVLVQGNAVHRVIGQALLTGSDDDLISRSRVTQAQRSDRNGGKRRLSTVWQILKFLRG